MFHECLLLALSVHIEVIADLLKDAAARPAEVLDFVGSCWADPARGLGVMMVLEASPELLKGNDWRAVKQLGLLLVMRRRDAHRLSLLSQFVLFDGLG